MAEFDGDEPKMQRCNGIESDDEIAELEAAVDSMLGESAERPAAQPKATKAASNEDVFDAASEAGDDGEEFGEFDDAENDAVFLGDDGEKAFDSQADDTAAAEIRLDDPNVGVFLGEPWQPEIDANLGTGGNR